MLFWVGSGGLGGALPLEIFLGSLQEYPVENEYLLLNIYLCYTLNNGLSITKTCKNHVCNELCQTRIYDCTRPPPIEPA